MEAPTTAINMFGQVGRRCCRTKMSAAEPTPMQNAAMLTVGSACPSAASFGSSGPGSGAAKVRPPRSLIWLARMVTAMPQVNPTVTACGM